MASAIPGSRRGQQGSSQLGMEAEGLQDLPSGAAGGQGEEERKTSNTGRNRFEKTSCLDFRRYFRCFSSENTSVLSNTWAHLNNKRKN